MAVASTSPRLLELEPGDVIFPAAVIDGGVLPVARVVVDRVATYDELVAEGHSPYGLRFQAVAKPPLPRMNLRANLDQASSLRLRRETGRPLARRKSQPRQIDGQAFRSPQWIDGQSAALLTQFLESSWQSDDDTGVNDPVRVSRGLAPRMSALERRAVELRAMKIVESAYRRQGYRVEDVSKNASQSGAWDLTATNCDGDEVHIEVKGTTGSGDAVTITAGERRHAQEFAHPALAIVTGIRLRRGRSPAAEGGELRLHMDPWSPDDTGAWAVSVWRYEPLIEPTGDE